MPLPLESKHAPVRIATTRDRVVAASVRSPVTASRRHGRVRWERQLEGAAASLAPALTSHDAWVTLAADGHGARFSAVPRQMAEYRIRGVRADRRVRRLCELVTTRLLTPALTSAPMPDLPLPLVLHAWEEGYRRMSEAFASVIAEEAADDGTVVDIQDIALAGAAERIRASTPGARIALQVHSGFAGAAVVERLPYILSADLLRGMLACDAVGFQAHRDLAGFAQACSEFLGAHVRGNTVEWEGRTVRLDVFADTVDEATTRQQAAHADPGVLRVADDDRIVAWTGSADPSANALGAVEGFAALLEDGVHRGTARLYLKVDSSRQDPPEHRDYLIAVQRAVAELNAKFASEDWVPVALDCSSERRNGFAALARADVLLANPSVDGAGLALQRAALLSSRAPAVVLSRSAGAYERFGDVVVAVDAADAADTARGLRAALRLPAADREARMETIRERVVSWTPQQWLHARVAALAARRVRRAPALAAWYGARPQKGGAA